MCRSLIHRKDEIELDFNQISNISNLIVANALISSITLFVSLQEQTS